jgi:hypothetical protein
MEIINVTSKALFTMSDKVINSIYKNFKIFLFCSILFFVLFCYAFLFSIFEKSANEFVISNMG